MFPHGACGPNRARLNPQSPRRNTLRPLQSERQVAPSGGQRYERLAHYLEVEPDTLPDTLFDHRRQAGCYSLGRILRMPRGLGLAAAALLGRCFADASAQPTAS
jgi:hypothetical protein